MPKQVDLDARIVQVNARLKGARIRISLQRRSGKIVAQATLPPKPGSKTEEWKQQRISLAPATPEGLKLAEREAWRIGAALDFGDFDWTPYLKTSCLADSQLTVPPTVPPTVSLKSEDRTIREWIEAFEEYYFSCRARSPKTQTTWDGDYLASFKKLRGERLDRDSLLAAVLSTEPDSRTRKRVCLALNALAKFAGIEIDLKPYKGRHSGKQVNPRNLPSDEQIVEWYYRIQNPAWQWAYGIIATYGLRPHEVFHLETSGLNLDLPTVVVLPETKTGEREVWPFHPEWVDLFNLREVNLPAINGRNNAELGNRATKYFRLWVDLPFHLYDLRHAWARRTLELGFETALAAKQMGHSFQLHTTTYYAWIGRAVHNRAYQALFSGK